MPLITLENLSRFLGKVKDYVDSKVGISGATGAEFAQKSIESIPNTIYTATSDDGVTYTVTVPGVTELYAGLRIYVKFSRASSTTMPKINVNNLGEKGIRQPLGTNSVSTVAGYNNTWISAGCPIKLTYTGTLWKTEHQRTSAASMYGSVNIANGGTGANNAADALTNLGAVSRTEFESEISRLESLINGGN
jgi:hypothetical protein